MALWPSRLQPQNGKRTLEVTKIREFRVLTLIVLLSSAFCYLWWWVLGCYNQSLSAHRRSETMPRLRPKMEPRVFSLEQVAKRLNPPSHPPQHHWSPWSQGKAIHSIHYSNTNMTAPIDALLETCALIFWPWEPPKWMNFNINHMVQDQILPKNGRS